LIVDIMAKSASVTPKSFHNESPQTEEVKDEELGYFYEALLVRSVAAIRPKIIYEVHVRLPNVKVISDVVIPCASKPDMVILATYSEAESGTHMKFWRNVSEILEVRQNHPSARVVNVVFPSNWKPGLMPLTMAISTLQIQLNADLSNSFLEIATQVRNAGNRSLEQILNWLSANKPPIIESAVTQVATEIKSCLKHETDRTYWTRYAEISGKVSRTKVIYNNDCQYKKGLISLSLLSDEDVEEVLSKRDANQLAIETRDRCLRVGAIMKFEGHIHRYEYDETIVSLRTGLTNKTITSALGRVRSLHSDDEFELTGPVRGSGNLDIYSFLEKVSELRHSESELRKWLKNQMTQWHSDNIGSRNLPLDLAYILAKNLDSKVSHRIVSNFAGLPMIGGLSPLPKFLYGKGNLPIPTIAKVAEFFSVRFSRGSLPSADEVWVTLLSQVKDKLIKHKYVNYLHYLCLNRCEELGLNVLSPETPGVVVGNNVAEYCRSALGLDVSSDVANSKFSFFADDGSVRYVFLIISAYDSTHKHKEYPGRWRCATVSFDKEGFKWGDSNASCVVVLDGVWKTLFKNINEALSGFDLPGIRCVIDIQTFMKLDFRLI